MDTLGFVTFALGEYGDAEAYYRESLELFDIIGDQYGRAMALGGIGLVDWAIGAEKLEEATLFLQQSLLLCRSIGHQGQVAGRLAGLARIANDQGHYAQAQQLAQEGVVIARELGSPVYLAHLLSCLGETAYRAGDLVSARLYLLEALQLTLTTGLFAHLGIVLFHYAVLLVAESTAPPTATSPLQTQALTLFLLVQQHPATWHMYKTRAAQRAAALIEQTPDLYPVVAASLATMPPLSEVATNLLAETTGV